jgi:predicted nucleic acid-binding protein
VTAFSDYLTRGPGVRIVPIDSAAARRAAELRSAHNLTFIDAFQAAIAEASSCDVMLTNDADLKRCALPHLEVVLVSQL